jgi:ELWxxDGT repeat protein
MKTSFWRRWWQSGKRSRPVSHGKPRRRLVQVEQLEDRTLLSGAPQVLADINLGIVPSPMVLIGSTAYFVANDGTHGNELWKTDGTAAGTVVVEDVSGAPFDLTNVNGTLFFGAGAPSAEELWKSDGTAAGTVMIAELGPGSSNAYLSHFTNVNGTLFFSARDSITLELWKSDGTVDGTVMVKELDSGNTSSELTNVNGTLFFAANGELWKSDGTGAGTVSLTGAGSDPLYLTNVKGTLYFSAYDSTHGSELWKSDGTAAGTTMVKDINPDGDYGSYPANLTNVNGELYFSADDFTHGRELWKSDGTAAGTMLVADIARGSSNPSDLTNVGGELFFSADDGTHGAELWKSDGTITGTTMVKDINPGTTTTWYYTGTYGTYTRNITTTASYPSYITNVNGTLYFGANDGTQGEELWKSDGTAGGTTLVQDINPGSSWQTGYSTGPYGGTETWRAYLPNSSNPGGLTNLNGTLLFQANDGTHGPELWEVPAGPGLALSATSTIPTAGQADTVTITALNADGTPDTRLNGTVNITSSDPKVPSATVTLTNGSGQLSVTFETAGPQSISAALAQTPTDSGIEGDLIVQAAAAKSFTLTGFPSPVTVGAAGTFTVTAYDMYGNVATGYRGSVHFTSSDPAATVPANATLNNGTGQFSATLKTLGTNLSITATDTQNAAVTGTQTGIEVIPFASISGPPNAGALNQALTYTLGAGADPAGTVFTVSWGDGSSIQTTTTTVSHAYSTSGSYQISVTATADGLSSSPATESITVDPVTITVESDPARAGTEMLILASTANNVDLILAGNSSGVGVHYFNGTDLGNILPTNNETFALVEVFVGGSNDDLDARNLALSSVLIGGPGNDTLYGGSGRNLLIGGAGSDTVAAGTAGDILIGGTTSYDTNTAANQKALAYIMAEWDSSASYSTRMKQLSGNAGSGGLNGSYFLNSSTVFDDNATDYLYGYSLASGAALDWFFAHYAKTNGDQVHNLVSGEVVNRI